MLSYQHIYHAGNLADVHKHALLCSALAYMIRKEKPLSYIETHAGRGLYDLGADEALKTGEAAAGIASVAPWFATDHPYAQALTSVRDTNGPQAYAGSPILAGEILRNTDHMHLAELHPQEKAALEFAMSPYPARVLQQDGFEMALAITPPTPRRGMLLIDPSYEIKDDYTKVPRIIAQLHRKWNVGVLAVWYPVLASGAHAGMVAALRALELPNVLDHQVRFKPAREGHGMIGSGMFIVNAPYGLGQEAERLSDLFKTL